MRSIALTIETNSGEGASPSPTFIREVTQLKLFYLILLFLSGGYLLLQLAVYLLFGRELFPNSGELFEHKKSRVELQTIFPKNILRLVVFVFVSSLTGVLLETAGVVSWLGLPCAAAGGLAFNFLLSTAVSPLYMKFQKKARPTEKELENLEGIVTEDITPDMYGEICVKHGGKPYYFRAVSANSRELPAGTEIIVIYSEDSACFVESKDRFFDVLFDEKHLIHEPAEAPAAEPEKPNNEIGRA